MKPHFSLPIRVFASIGIILISYCFTKITGQSSCITAVGAIYGSPKTNERGKCLLPTPGNDGLYAVGMREDSVLIVKLNLMGQIIWARAFDIIPGVEDNVSSAIIDGEGMILTEGIAGDYTDGGNIFAFRYNPNTNQILWAKEYVNSTMRSYTFPVTQTANGDYLLGCNPHPPFPASTSDSELLQVSKANGNPVGGLDKVYNLGGSDEFTELVLYKNFIYGCGRYTDGAPNSKMRQTLMKIDPANLNQVWVKCGHVAQAQTARLYARDMIIDADIIYSVGLGDPTGTSSTNTKQYLQKTDINGNLVWVNQYELPGTNDWGHQIIKSGGGLVVLAGKLAAPSDIFLYKTDLDGAMLWAKQFQFSPPIITAIQVDRGNSQILEVGSNLFLTATGVTTNGSTDILIIRMDLDGNTNMPCVTSVSVSIPVIPVPNPVFYSVNPSAFNVSQSVNAETPDIVETAFPYNGACTVSDTVFEFIDAIICSGDIYEGYSVTGTYEDYFVTPAGCDSLRTLNLEVYDPLTTSEQVTICLGQSFNGFSTSGVYNEVYQTKLGCDSFHILTLNVVPLFSNLNIQICEGQSSFGYTVSGFYVDTIQGPPNECDTIRFLELDIASPTLHLDISICQGDDYLGYNQTGVYQDTLHGIMNQCDTLRQLTLTVLPILQSVITQSICAGDSFEGYSISGTYQDTFQTPEGCDSVRILQLIVSDTIVSSFTVDLCLGQSYEGYSVPGFYADTFQSSFGCDSIRQLTLQIAMPEKHIMAEICTGQHFEQYSIGGTYLDTLPGIAGDCDTLRELNLIVEPAQVTEVDQVICDGESYLGYAQAGTYLDTLVTADGCDSIRELHLQTMNPITNTIQSSLCEQLLTNYSQPGVYIDTFISVEGCDSVVRYVIEDAGLYIPNVFSPNADGINDVFTIFPYAVTELTIEYFGIFDRFGDMVYETKKWPIHWPGNDRNGKIFQPGVFAYVLIYECSEKRIVQHGNITLVK